MLPHRDGLASGKHNSRIHPTRGKKKKPEQLELNWLQGINRNSHAWRLNNKENEVDSKPEDYWSGGAVGDWDEQLSLHNPNENTYTVYLYISGPSCHSWSGPTILPNCLAHHGPKNIYIYIIVNLLLVFINLFYLTVWYINIASIIVYITNIFVSLLVPLIERISRSWSQSSSRSSMAVGPGKDTKLLRISVQAHMVLSWADRGPIWREHGWPDFRNVLSIGHVIHSCPHQDM